MYRLNLISVFLLATTLLPDVLLLLCLGILLFRHMLVIRERDDRLAFRVYRKGAAILFNLGPIDVHSTLRMLVVLFVPVLLYWLFLVIFLATVHLRLDLWRNYTDCILHVDILLRFAPARGQPGRRILLRHRPVVGSRTKPLDSDIAARTPSLTFRTLGSYRQVFTQYIELLHMVDFLHEGYEVIRIF